MWCLAGVKALSNVIPEGSRFICVLAMLDQDLVCKTSLKKIFLINETYAYIMGRTMT
jgi:lipopolysaccharide biosynthesis glycosyltransferase